MVSVLSLEKELGIPFTVRVSPAEEHISDSPHLPRHETDTRSVLFSGRRPLFVRL